MHKPHAATTKYFSIIGTITMQQKIKRYNNTIRNHVRLIGYRGQIELMGRDLGLHGIVFNAPDGAVKVIAEGEESLLDVFFDDLKRIREGIGIETKEVSRDADLPIPFSRVATDENLEQMRRFDKGIELLGRIDNNTSLIADSQTKLVEGQTILIKSQSKLMGGQDKLLESQSKLVEGQGKLLGGQTKLVEGQDKVVTLLEKIEAKIK